MRTPFGWTLPSQTSLQVVCACCALWGAPAAALAAPEPITPTPVVSTPASAAPISTASDGTRRMEGASFKRGVLPLVVMGCLVGMIIGWVVRSPPDTRFRLLHKPKKMPLSVLVPPTRAARLIPGDSPNATRALSSCAPMPRPAPVSARRLAGIDYIAVFSDSTKPGAGTRVDYLLEAGDGAEESLDALGEFDGSPRDTG